MKRIPRVVGAAGLVGALVLGGAGLAQAALSWGTLSVSSGGTVQGQGYGDAWRGDAYHAKLSSTLRDLRTGSGRTYAQLTGYGKAPNFTVQSGRRADGGSAFAVMSVRSYTSSASLDGYRAAVKVCQDVPGRPDPCSGSDYGWL